MKRRHSNENATPGPWRAQRRIEYTNGPAHTCFDIEINRHDMAGYVAVVDGMRGECLEANAKLIAAAPDLLEACKAANLRLLQQKYVAGDAELLQELQLAIAKAEAL